MKGNPNSVYCMVTFPVAYPMRGMVPTMTISTNRRIYKNISHKNTGFAFGLSTGLKEMRFRLYVITPIMIEITEVDKIKKTSSGDRGGHR